MSFLFTLKMTLFTLKNDFFVVLLVPVFQIMWIRLIININIFIHCSLRQERHMLRTTFNESNDLIFLFLQTIEFKNNASSTTIHCYSNADCGDVSHKSSSNKIAYAKCPPNIMLILQQVYVVQKAVFR